MTSLRERHEVAYLVALLQTQPDGMSWGDIAGEVLERGSPSSVWHEHQRADLLGTSDEAPEAAAREIERWTSDGTRMITINDADYPDRLRAIHQAPPVLFARGDVRVDDRAVSIVGSRAASNAGVDLAARVATAVVEIGLTVVSGLAMGIDTAAHRAALDAGGRTVAFLGTGIRKKYPRGNEALQDEIGAKGLVLSQFWPDAPPRPHTFIMRNAVMSGYGLATIVIEAGEKSGSRAQARMAVEHGRPVILTDRVVHANAWAQALVSRPGVHVASSFDGLLDIVESLRLSNASAESRDLFDAIAQCA